MFPVVRWVPMVPEVEVPLVLEFPKFPWFPTFLVPKVQLLMVPMVHDYPWFMVPVVHGPPPPLWFMVPVVLRFRRRFPFTDPVLVPEGFEDPEVPSPCRFPRFACSQCSYVLLVLLCRSCLCWMHESFTQDGE